jgi:hypothetical protein
MKPRTAMILRRPASIIRGLTIQVPPSHGSGLLSPRNMYGGLEFLVLNLPDSSSRQSGLLLQMKGS